MRVSVPRSCLLAFMVVSSGSAKAGETITYTYDARGRVMQVARSGGVVADYTYDRADNRTAVTVTGATSGSGPGSGGGASVPQAKYAVVPLNGYSLIIGR